MNKVPRAAGLALVLLTLMALGSTRLGSQVSLAANRQPSATPSVSASSSVVPDPSRFDVPSPTAAPSDSPSAAATASGAAADSQAAPAPSAAPVALAASRYIAGSGAIGSASSQDFSSLHLIAGAGNSMASLLPGAAKNPDVNRQHTLVVFERYPGFTWIANADGSAARVLSPTNGGGWMEPRFAPDGRTVVLTHDVGGGHQEIFSIDSATGAVAQLTNAPQYPWKWRPSIDPSGSRLIVTYGTDGNNGSGPHSHVGVAHLGNGVITDFTQLTPIDTNRPSYDGEFSADGAAMIFDAGGKIWISAADGSGAHSVADGRLGRFDVLTPGQILFTHDVAATNTHTQLWGANIDGSQAHMVADGNFAESFCDLP